VDSIADFSKESGVIWVDDCRGRSGEGEEEEKRGQGTLGCIQGWRRSRLRDQSCFQTTEPRLAHLS